MKRHIKQHTVKLFHYLLGKTSSKVQSSPFTGYTNTTHRLNFYLPSAPQGAGAVRAFEYEPRRCTNSLETHRRGRLWACGTAFSEGDFWVGAV